MGVNRANKSVNLSIHSMRNYAVTWRFTRNASAHLLYNAPSPLNDSHISFVLTSPMSCKLPRIYTGETWTMRFGPIQNRILRPIFPIKMCSVRTAPIRGLFLFLFSFEYIRRVIWGIFFQRQMANNERKRTKLPIDCRLRRERDHWSGWRALADANCRLWVKGAEESWAEHEQGKNN